MNRLITILFFVLLSLSLGAQEDLYNGDNFFVSENQIFFVKGDFTNDHIEFENNGDFTLIGNLENLKSIQDVGIGTFRLMGLNQQILNIVEPFSTFNFEIDNAEGSTMIGSADISVFADLDFTNGIIQSHQSSLIIFKAGAIHFYASDMSHIDGPAIKEGYTQFTFPIGKNNRLRPLRISETNSINSFRAEYFQETYSSLIPDNTLNNVSDFEYWNFEKIFGSEDIKLTLVWDEQSFIDPVEADLNIAHFNQTNWTNVNSSSNLPEQLETDLTSIEVVENYGDFTFGSSQERTLLRDALRAFDVSKNECFTKVNWQSIERSRNIELYEIWRKKGNKDFELIETVFANNIRSIETYQYTDETVEPEFIYTYKIITHFSGETSSETDPLLIKTSCQEYTLYIYPNPIIPGNNLNIHVESDIKKKLPISIVDELGRVLIQQDLLIDHGSNEFIIDVQRFGMAEYYIWTPEEEDLPTLEFQVIR